MKKSVLGGLGRTASKRVKRLSAAAAQTAEELLQKSYVGTAEQTLRGAETVTTMLHEPDGDIAKAKSLIADEQPKKTAKKTAKQKAKKKAKTKERKRTPKRSERVRVRRKIRKR